jgi:hypothetical protein
LAAIFYNPNPNTVMFKGNFPVSNIVKIEGFDNALSPDRTGPGIPLGSKLSLSIITDVSIDNSETVQYFLTFDDVINYFYFGKGLGTITINGMLFSDCDGNVPGVNAFYEIISNKRGQPMTVSLGAYGFTGIISNYRTAVAADPTMLIEFQLTLTIISHTLRPPIFNPACGINAIGDNSKGIDFNGFESNNSTTV